MGFLHVGQAGLELLTSGDPPASASQSGGIIDRSHCCLVTIVIFIVGSAIVFALVPLSAVTVRLSLT